MTSNFDPFGTNSEVSALHSIEREQTLVGKVQRFADILEAVATYGHGNAEEAYKHMRSFLMKHVDYASLVPNALKISRTAAQFRREMQTFGGYKERRAEIDRQFAPLLDAMEIGIGGVIGALTIPPVNWTSTTGFRLFVSHIAKHKRRATRLKECLRPLAIDAFVAHEDIEPTRQWQVEIERGLRTMDALLAIHTEGFGESVWTQQEIGFALGRGVKIISFRMGEDPVGFLSAHQALSWNNRSADQIADEINNILSGDARTSTKLNAAKEKSAK